MTTALLDPTTTATIRIEAWEDPVLDRLGHDPRSGYVETYWLPVLGPSTTWLLRRLAAGLESEPGGFDIDLEETARSLGLGAAGDRQGKHTAFMRTLGRCVDFEMAQLRAPATMAVRRRLPPIGRRQLLRLPAGLREQHDRYLAEQRQLPSVERMRAHARLLAASLADMGEDRSTTEVPRMRWSFHPALARECTAWAYEQPRAAAPPPA